VTGAAVLAAQKRDPVKPALTATEPAQKRETGKPAAPVNKVKMVTVRVVDIKGRDVPNVEVENVDHGSTYDSAEVRYRTGADGRFRAPVDPNYRRFAFRAQPDDQTLGWANISMANLWPEATDKNPVTLVLLPLNHRVEGLIRDKRGKPIRGVQVRVNHLLHDANNGFGRGTSLGSAVTDLAGRYTLSVPTDTVVTFAAHHPRYVGPSFSCGPEERTIAAVTLDDAGGIEGTVIDSTTGKPVEGVRVGAELIEIKLDEPLGGGGGGAFSDARGHFQAGGLAPGVYNLLFMASPKGRRLTARAVEGVRVKAGEDSRADLVMIEGRRLLGTAIHVNENTPMARVPVSCYSAARPRSGAACQTTITDDQGRFEHFVPPGPALVYIGIPALGSRHMKTLTIPSDRDPEPVRLEMNDDPAVGFFLSLSRPVECNARVRLNATAGNALARDEIRSLTGRIFDTDGSPIAGIRVSYNAEKFVSATTDRMGLFRLKGLPPGDLELELQKDGYGSGQTAIPPDAWEVDLTLPRQPAPLE